MKWESVHKKETEAYLSQLKSVYVCKSDNCQGRNPYRQLQHLHLSEMLLVIPSLCSLHPHLHKPYHLASHTHTHTPHQWRGQGGPYGPWGTLSRRLTCFFKEELQCGAGWGRLWGTLSWKSALATAPHTTHIHNTDAWTATPITCPI